MSQLPRLELDQRLIIMLNDSKVQEESTQLTDLQVEELELAIDRNDLDLCYISAYPGGFYSGDLDLESSAFANFQEQMQKLLNDVIHLAVFNGIIDIRSEKLEESVAYRVKDSVLTAHAGSLYEAS